MAEEFVRKLIGLKDEDKRFIYIKDGGKLNLKPISNVNIYNDQEMQILANRPVRMVKQQSVFKKTASEKAKLKQAKKLVKEMVIEANLNPKVVMNAKPTELIQAFNKFDMGSYRGLAKSITTVEPERFCSLHGYLQKQKDKVSQQ